MKRFLHAHATHPEAHMAMALVAAQIEAQRREPGRTDAPNLGWLYLTDHFAAHAEGLLAEARQRWPGAAWVGAVGVGICASGVEYWDEPALSLMLAELPASQFRVFSGALPLGDFDAHTAQVHADPATADLADLIADMSRRTATGYLFGGLASARTRTLHIANQVLQGGLSGVAFGPGVALVSRITQGCQPVGPLRRVTEADHNVVASLDGEPALDCLLRDLKLQAQSDPRAALPRLRETLVGLSDGPRPPSRPGVPGAQGSHGGPGHRGASATPDEPDADTPSPGGFDAPARRGAFGPDTRVRHLVGLDPARRGVAIGDLVEAGMQIAFCTRNTEAARRDLVRICAEIREEVEPEDLSAAPATAHQGAGQARGGTADAGRQGIAGAVYVSCTGRGGAHFGAPSAELALIRHALGEVPLVGFYAAGEIARHHLYGYTGVLTVFRSA